MNSDRLGSVLRDGDALALRYERRLAHAPHKVWRALTESESLRHWFPADIVGDRRAGAQVRLPFWPEGAKDALATLVDAGVDVTEMDFEEALPGEIRVWEPPRVFELVWGNPEGVADVLRFELQQDADGTLLIFTTWPGEPGPLGHAGTAAGWHACLDALHALLDDGSVGEPDTRSVLPMRERYEALLTGAGRDS